MSNQLHIDVVGFSNGDVDDGVGFVACDDYGEAFELEYDADVFYQTYPDEEALVDKVLDMPPFEDYIDSKQIISKFHGDFNPRDTIVVSNYASSAIRRK